MLVVGRALKAHGVRGDVKAECFMDAPGLFSAIKTVYADGEAYEVEKSRVNGNFVLLKLKGVDTMDDAEKLRGKELSVRREELPAPAEGRYYIDDLIGCSVFDGAEKIGVLAEILQHGSADVYVVHGRRGVVMFPLVDGVVRSVDIGGKRIEVDGTEFGRVAVYED